MKLKTFFDFAVQKGIEVDLRGKTEIDRLLKDTKKKYNGVCSKEKVFFDKESLKNPYSDTRILWGDLDREIKTVIVGIDLEGPELLLVDRLNSKRKKKIDLAISHHPEAQALAGLYNVMGMQTDILSNAGVPVAAAETMLNARIEEVERRLSPVNHMRSVDFARLLNIPFICLHTPADNHVVSYLKRIFKLKKPTTIGDIINILEDIPEYAHSAKNNNGPKIFAGRKDSKCGKIFVDMTGGTEGAKNIFQKLSNAGISTVIAMHLSEEHLKKAKEAHINVVIAGHISSDNLGLNLLLDKLSKKDKIEVIECSGFKRIRR